MADVPSPFRLPFWAKVGIIGAAVFAGDFLYNRFISLPADRLLGIYKEGMNVEQYIAAKAASPAHEAVNALFDGIVAVFAMGILR